MATAISLVFLFSRVWIAPIFYNLRDSRPLFISLFSGVTFFSLLLLVTKVFFLSCLFHILIALYVGILFGLFSPPLTLTLNAFLIGPIVGGAFYSLTLQSVYALISFYFFVGLVFILKRSPSTDIKY